VTAKNPSAAAKIRIDRECTSKQIARFNVAARGVEQCLLAPAHDYQQ
jgi:hypothetical protein